LLARPERDRAAAGEHFHSGRARTDHAEFPALAPVGDGRGTHRDGRAPSRLWRTNSAFASFAASRRISLDPRQEPDIHLLRYAEHIPPGDRRGILPAGSLPPLRKRAVSTKAALAAR
jgi:hypothetical protein